MKDAISARIDGVLAATANQAVIFRRGPSRYTQMLVWDLDSHVVTAGQWVKGAVLTRRCDVSPDGSWVVIAGTNYSRNHQNKTGAIGLYTLISRPPYFSPVCVWNNGPMYFGGGAWDGDHHLFLNHHPDVDDVLKGTLPNGIRVSRLNANSNDELSSRILLAKGWKPTETGFEKEVTGGWAVRNCPDEPAVVLQNHRREPLLGHAVTWAESDRLGRLVYAEAGKLWIWPNFPSGEPTMVADLNPNRFEEVIAPYSTATNRAVRVRGDQRKSSRS